MITGRRLIAATAALALTGCTAVQSERPAMEIVSKYLDRDGIEFSVTASPAWRMSSEYFDRTAEKTIWKNGDLTPDDRHKLMFYLTSWHLLRDLSGLEHASGSGRSTVIIEGKKCHSRGFLALPPAAPGLINEVLAPENRIAVEKFISGLPANCHLAMTIDLRPTALLDALARSGTYQETFAGAFPAAIPIPEFLKNTAGIWELVFLNGDNNAFKIEFPDPEGKIFNFCRLLIFGKSGKKQLSRLKLHNDAIVCHRENRTVYYSSAEVEKEFETNTCRFVPGKNRDFLFHRLPEKAAIILFSSAGESTSSTMAGKLNILYPDCELPTAVTVSREDDGLLLCSNDQSSWLSFDWQNALDLVELLNKIELSSDRKDKQDNSGNPETAGSAGETVKEKENDSCECAKLLPQAAGMLDEKPELSAGKYELTAGKYVFYFGKIQSDIPVPQFMLLPHGNTFCTLFSDGKVEQFELSGNCNFRRIIAFLQTMKKYDEKIFRQLMKLATVFDYQEER